MAKHDAVERMMAMATEKRADRIPSGGRVIEQSPPDSEILAPDRPQALAELPADETSRPSAADRGRQVLQAIRPLLPAVAGAMRLVDHGAVQALARLLPLLGGNAAAAQSAPQQEQEARELLAVHTAQASFRKDLEALQLQLAEHLEEGRRLRSQLDRLSSEETVRVQEVSNLSDRVRLLSACTIILLMLVVAQMILLVVIFHR